MVDFGELAAKAENLAKEHADQVDDAIDKAAGLLGGKFGHATQVEQGAEKLKGLIPGEGDDDAPAANTGKGGGHKGAHAGPREGKAGGGKGKGGAGKGGAGKGGAGRGPRPQQG